MPETDREDGLVSSTSTCHWMPCSISYDGVAPIQMLFNPELVHTNDNQNLHQQAEEEKNDLISSYQQAASFRGRGLLAQGAYELPEGIVGSVLIPSEVDKSRLHQGESFREVLEWEHESDSKRLVIKKSEGDEREVHNESSIEKGLALMDLLRAVHEPIPIKE